MRSLAPCHTVVRAPQEISFLVWLFTNFTNYNKELQLQFNSKTQKTQRTQTLKSSKSQLFFFFKLCLFFLKHNSTDNIYPLSPPNFSFQHNNICSLFFKLRFFLFFFCFWVLDKLVQFLCFEKMSFQDLEAGRPLRQQRQRQQQQLLQDPSQALASGIFQINTAVSSFSRLVNSLGTPKDTLELRDKLSVFFLLLFL